MTTELFIKYAKKTRMRLAPLMRLKKEAFVLKELNKIELQYFRVPKIIEVHNDRIIMQRVVPDEKPSKKEALKVIMELENLEVNFPAKIKLFNSIFDSSECRILYMALKSVSLIGFSGLYSTVKLLYKLRKSQKKIKKVFLHNDNIYSEILKEHGVLYLVDFESSKYEKRWVLKDILSVNYIKNKTFNLKYIIKNIIDKSTVNLKSQVRFFLLEYFFVRLVYYEEEFRFNVLDDKEFDIFYEGQISIE